MIENPLGDENGQAHSYFRFRRELPCDALFLILFFLPWARNRGVRIGSLVASAILLYFIPLSWGHFPSIREGLLTIFGRDSYLVRGGDFNPLSDELGLYGTHAQFHPAVTLLYFLITAAWSAAIGVTLGLRSRLTREKAITLLLLLGPTVEWGAYFLAFFLEVLDRKLITDWMFLWLMLSFYLTPMAILWMGIKWNLLFYLSRKPIRLE
jgi:hypothetical protein